MALKKKIFKAVSIDNLDEDTISNIRLWRNQDFVKKSSLQQHDITQEEHLRFIDKLKTDPNRQMYVFYLDEEPFAVYQYEVNPEKREVINGYYLISEKYQMLGYGAILIYAVNYINACCLDVDYNYGTVLSSNSNQLRFQKDAVLVETKKNIVQIDGQMVDVYCYRTPIQPYDEKSRETRLVSKMVEIESIRNKEMYI